MNQLPRTLALALVCQLLITSLVHAQVRPRGGSLAEPAKLWSLRGGIGLMEDPDAFLMNFEIERFMRDEVPVGFALQLGVDDDYTVVSPMIFTRYVFNMSTLTNEVARKLQPYVQAGAGITHIDLDRRGRDRDGTDFMVSLGIGLDFPLTDTLGIGSRALLHLIPGQVLNERIYFSWEIISVRYHW